ncbi:MULTISPECIES: hypothetical protein [unclassified Streptomyces]|uniref:hypothetical protein n=1 Tax=unclassified Streptomyces TaxID=2593676 RepID=UPI0033C06DBD
MDYLAVYVLKYLGKDNKRTPQERVTKWMRAMNGLSAAGQAWLEDATRTAWTLVKRYQLATLAGLPEHAR